MSNIVLLLLMMIFNAHAVRPSYPTPKSPVWRWLNAICHARKDSSFCLKTALEFAVCSGKHHRCSKIYSGSFLCYLSFAGKESKEKTFLLSVNQHKIKPIIVWMSPEEMLDLL